MPHRTRINAVRKYKNNTIRQNQLNVVSIRLKTMAFTPQFICMMWCEKTWVRNVSDKTHTHTHTCSERRKCKNHKSSLKCYRFV